MSCIEFPKFYKHRKCEKYYAVLSSNKYYTVSLIPGITSMQLHSPAKLTIIELLEHSSREIFYDKLSEPSEILHTHVTELIQLCELQVEGM
jgi:sorbitol-specific phosphotransferase system component IIC